MIETKSFVKLILYFVLSEIFRLYSSKKETIISRLVLVFSVSLFRSLITFRCPRVPFNNIQGVSESLISLFRTEANYLTVSARIGDKFSTTISA